MTYDAARKSLAAILQAQGLRARVGVGVLGDIEKVDRIIALAGKVLPQLDEF